MNLMLHISTELFACGASATYHVFLAVKPAENQTFPLMKYSQDGAWQRLDWEKFMNCSLNEPRLTRMADWQMKHKDESERQSANVLKPVPIPFSSLLPLYPLHLTPAAPPLQTQLPFSSLSICLWICHYGNLTPEAEDEEGGCLRSDK